MSIKARRHSFSSVEEAAKEIGKDTPSNAARGVGKVVQGERKRKSPDSRPEGGPEAKRFASPVTLAHLMASIQDTSRQDSKMFSREDVCCLPGGIRNCNMAETSWLGFVGYGNHVKPLSMLI